MSREATGLAGARHKSYETLGSTNAEALALARAGERGPLWVTARSQNAGRGRRGSTWSSPPGNLYATLLLGEPALPQDAPQLSFVAALALRDAIAQCAPLLASDLKLKWPNDLLAGGKKVAGILIDGESEPIFAVAIGIGVNCTNHPQDTAFPATDLAASGTNVSPDTLFAALSPALEHRLLQWQRGAGFSATRKHWLTNAAGVGDEIRVRLPERELRGRFDGLDERGRLLLRKHDGQVEPITAGEVFAFQKAGSQ
jgi:BirA family transcriptional regulator, biotin operon repressor / biotin---[acetyl-CoA-carboxylase] ligase